MHCRRTSQAQELMRQMARRQLYKFVQEVTLTPAARRMYAGMPTAEEVIGYQSSAKFDGVRPNVVACLLWLDCSPQLVCLPDMLGCGQGWRCTALVDPLCLLACGRMYGGLPSAEEVLSFHMMPWCLLPAVAGAAASAGRNHVRNAR